jgi:hypothetical protein
LRAKTKRQIGLKAFDKGKNFEARRGTRNYAHVCGGRYDYINGAKIHVGKGGAKMSEENITKYVLMNKNTPVLEFEYNLKRHEPVRIIKEFNLNYAPPVLSKKKTDEAFVDLFEYWWDSRLIPESRQHLRFFTDSLSKLPAGVVDRAVVFDLTEKNFGLSLSDQYWLNDDKQSMKWEDINFFHNDFSEDIGNMLLNVKKRIPSSADFHLNLKTPDATLQGVMMKGWKIIGGKRMLFKNDHNMSSRVPYNELIATKLYESLLSENEFVKYDIVRSKGKIFSACENMIADSEELVSAAQIIKAASEDLELEKHYGRYVSSCKSLGVPEIETNISKMLICDFLLANEDRHTGNFGLIRNVESLEYRTAPFYDNGDSLFWDIENVEKNEVFNFGMQAFFAPDPISNIERHVSDLSWFDAGKLNGFADVAKEILMSSRFAKISDSHFDSVKTIDNICYGLEQRIDFVRGRQHELLPPQVNLGSLADDSPAEKPSADQKLTDIEDSQSESPTPAPIKPKSR